jgi:two-component system sensor kinase FixL
MSMSQSGHTHVEADRVLAALLDASPDAIVEQDLAGAIIGWNPAAEAIFGFAAGDIVGRSVTALVASDDAPRLEAALADAGRGSRPEPFDVAMHTRAGQRIDVALSVSPLRDSGGKVVGTLLVGRDLTAQRRTEHALRRSEDRWRSIVEFAVDAIVMIDRRGLVEVFNPAAERMFGYRSDEVIGRNVSMLMPEPHASQHDDYMQRYRTTGERRIIGIGREATGRRKDGSEFPIHLSVAEITVDGESKFTGIVRDLTERVGLEVRLREEAGLVRIGQLAAVLAHEIKNPLAAVSGALQMLRFHLASGEHQQVLDEVLRRIDALSELMTDLLLYARPPRAVLREIDLTELLAGLIVFLRGDPEWSAVDVALEGRLDPVYADPDLIRIALQNLLLNAAQASGFNGRLDVRLVQDGTRGHIDISDAGPGIPPDIRDKLFTPFFTTKARGTGLGLATVRRIADAHAGRVEILRSGREGTTMRLSVPLARAAR